MFQVLLRTAFLDWSGERWDSNPVSLCKISSLQILSWRRCRKCQGSRGALLVFARRLCCWTPPSPRCRRELEERAVLFKQTACVPSDARHRHLLVRRDRVLGMHNLMASCRPQALDAIYGDGSRPSARVLAISGCCRWCRQATTTEPSTFTRYQTPYLNWRRLARRTSSMIVGCATPVPRSPQLDAVSLASGRAFYLPTLRESVNVLFPSCRGKGGCRPESGDIEGDHPTRRAQTRDHRVPRRVRHPDVMQEDQQWDGPSLTAVPHAPNAVPDCGQAAPDVSSVALIVRQGPASPYQPWHRRRLARSWEGIDDASN